MSKKWFQALSRINVNTLRRAEGNHQAQNTEGIVQIPTQPRRSALVYIRQAWQARSLLGSIREGPALV